MIRVDVWLPDPAGVLALGAFGADALIRVERADLDLSPPYDLGSYAEVDTIPIVATSVQYQWWDPDGIATSSYRWRASDSGNTTTSPYSAPFAGTNPAGVVLPRSYASLDRLLSLFETKPTKPARVIRLAQLLATATNELNEELGSRDYFRHPEAGSASWSPGRYDIDGPILHAHNGIISLDSLTVDGTALTVDTDYVLHATGPREVYDPNVGLPAFHIELLNGRRFPRDPSLTVGVGALGWPSIPEALVEGSAARARQLAYADQTYSGALPGPEEMNPEGRVSMAAMDRFWPSVTYRFMQRELDRFTACLFANSNVRLPNEFQLGRWIG